MIALSATFHDASVNSAGLMALGIGPGTPDPPGGQIIRDRRGRPTGALVESAAFLAEAASRMDLLGRDGAGEAWIGRLERYAVTLLRAGITRVGDAAVPPDAMALYARAAAEDRLPLTVHRMPVGHSIPDPRAEPPVLGSGPERAPAGPAKLLADGGERCALCLTPRQAVVTAGSLLRALALGRDAVGRRTPRSLLLALAGRGGMLRPTGDGRLGNGIRVLDDAALRQAVEAAARAGTQVAVHAIGNGAVGATLDALERSGTLAALPGSPRIEHAMIIDAALARRMGDSGVMAVVQGSFVTALGDDLARLALPDPLRLLPFGTLAAAGVPLAFGSDHPAAPVDMIAAIRAAVTRRTAGGLVLDPAEALTVSQALEAATRGGAAALGVDGLVGSLAPGMVADLVVLSADPVALGPDHLAGVRVLATAVGGDLRWWEPQ